MDEIDLDENENDAEDSVSSEGLDDQDGVNLQDEEQQGDQNSDEEDDEQQHGSSEFDFNQDD